MNAVGERVRARLQRDDDPLPGNVAERRMTVRAAVAKYLAEEAVLLAPEERAALESEIVNSVTGLGPLEPLLRDPSVTEVMVNAPDSVWVERSGRLERAGVAFAGADAVMHLIERIVGPLGLRVDASRPWVDARLPDGSRVHAIVPPVAVGGPALTIRKFSRSPLQMEDLVERGALSAQMASFLRSCVAARVNVIVSGGAGAGKTTLLNALSSHIPESERVVTIEDAAELRLQQRHVVALETRPENAEGVGGVGVRELVRNALRMRPDRIVVGEVRGAEALDMLHAMNTGHEGSLSSAHANSPADLVTRLEAMVLMGDVAFPLAAVRAQIGAGLDLIVHVERSGAGRRSIAQIAEVRGGPDIHVVPLVIANSDSWECTGEVPRFLPRIRAAGEPLPVLFGGRR